MATETRKALVNRNAIPDSDASSMQLHRLVHGAQRMPVLDAPFFQGAAQHQHSEQYVRDYFGALRLGLRLGRDIRSSLLQLALSALRFALPRKPAPQSRTQMLS